ncbi:MAG: hypothetical protein SFW65_05660, partial [Alphaproteobacteria bacterium]|nr:hypothetical protein [Alphaproteobacteria bacterium]
MEEYRLIESSIQIKNINRDVTYNSPINFNESMTAPRHRWFPYKEGFSPSFVRGFLNQHLKNKSGIVFDPFSGVGTTSIVAAECGLVAKGFDVSAMAIFVANVKALNLTESEIKKFRKQMEDFLKAPLKTEHTPPSNDTVISYFEEDCLSALLRVKYYILNIANKNFQSLFFLAFLSIIESYSTHRKAGNGVKMKMRVGYDTPNLIKQVKSSMVGLLENYCADLQQHPLQKIPEFNIASCLNESAYDGLEQIACVITSPPYANCFDYSKIYLRELWLGDFYKSTDDQRLFRNASLRS